MELHHYTRIFNTCYQAEEFLREYPDAKYRYNPTLPVAEAEAAAAEYKTKLRRYRSNMAKLLTIFLEHKAQKYKNHWQSADQYDFYVLTVMWMFGRGKFHIETIERSREWSNIYRDALGFLKPYNGTTTITGPIRSWPRTIKNEPSEEQLAQVQARLDQFESILRASTEDQLKKVVRLKLTMA